MSNPFHSALNDLVVRDAARMSGDDFAESRAGGIGRRVRTRRTVRAAGVGGASALAAGAVAVGVTQVPWGGTATPAGAGATDATTAEGSPFECGFHIRAEAAGTDHLWIENLTWSTPDEINERISWHAFQPEGADPADVPQALGTFDVPTVTVHDSLAASTGDHFQGVGGTTDPALEVRDGSLSGWNTAITYAQGTAFVAVAGGEVVGTLAEDPSGEAPLSVFLDGADVTMLNADDAFVACPGVSLPSESWAVYAVAGTVAEDASGTLHGPEYAWLRVSGPEDGRAHMLNPAGASS